jgi:tetratricopeptide (TPR) repeat protein
LRFSVVRYAKLAWYNRANVHGKLGETEKLFADYSQAIKLDPTYVSAWLNRGTAYLARRQYDQAIADLSQAIKVDRSEHMAWNNRGGHLPSTPTVPERHR